MNDLYQVHAHHHDIDYDYMGFASNWHEQEGCKRVVPLDVARAIICASLRDDSDSTVAPIPKLTIEVACVRVATLEVGVSMMCGQIEFKIVPWDGLILEGAEDEYE